MICQCELTTPKQAAGQYAEWASLFPDKYFVELVVYADETKRDKSHKRNAKYEGILGMSGFIASSEYWIKFCARWQAVLNKFDANYFHFREITRAGRQRAPKPFCEWDDAETDDFIYELAAIIGDVSTPDVAIPFGSNVFLAIPEHPKYRVDTWKQTFDVFFSNFSDTMNLHWPRFGGKVHFFIDRQENPGIITQWDSSHREHMNRDSRIGEYTPSDKRERVPLQAADMLAFSLGQGAERAFIHQQRQSCRIIDLFLFRNMYPRGHPNSLPWFINDESFKRLINDFREHKKIWDRERKAAGLKKTEYFPALHFTNYEK